MDVSYALNLVNNLTVRPGYKLRAERAWGFTPGLIDVTLECKTFDSSEPPNFPRAITIAPNAEIDVREMINDKELLAEIFRMIMRVEAHEWQEFLRFGPQRDYVAPFHPHTIPGQAAAMAYGATV